MPIVIEFGLWKGGVGKTTSALNVAARLAMLGYNTLIIDDDPQCNSTITLLKPEVNVVNSTRSLYLGTPLKDCVYSSVVKGLDIVPATFDLATVGYEIYGQEGNEVLLRDALDCDFAQKYDFIIIDTPPSLGPLVTNALMAANKLIVPISGYFSLEGLNQYREVIDNIRENTKLDLNIDHILLTRYDNRKRLHRDIRDKLIEVFGDKVLKTIITENVSLDEAGSYNQPIFTYAPRSKGAKGYIELTDELLSKWGV